MATSKSDAPQQEALEYYRDLVRPIFAGRKIILIAGPVAGLTGLARELRGLGTDRPFLLGSSVGTGPLPSPDEAEWRSLDIRTDDVISGIRSYEAQLANLPEEIRSALDRYDPDGKALVVGLILLGDVPEVAGRRRYGLRGSGWGALEDKSTVDALWDSVGVLRAPSEVVPAQEGAVRSAAKRLDLGMGTAWAGDAREGPNGGGAYVRWVRSERDAAEASRFFSAHCDRVRVMPFLEGVPCSIHGVVLPGGVVAFRPVEIITLRPRQGPGLLYAGVATFWDPPSADREAMRAMARRTGAELRDRVGYRGPFTIDGILTERGFRPTELNARFGAGLGVIARSVPRLPLAPLLLAAQAGEPLDFRPDLLEEVVVEGADAVRGGGGWTVLRQSRTRTETRPLMEHGDRYRVARPSEKPDAVLSVGPSDVGGFLHFAPDPERVPVGRSLAPRVIRAFATADREFFTRIGPLDGPREVR